MNAFDMPQLVFDTPKPVAALVFHDFDASRQSGRLREGFVTLHPVTPGPQGSPVIGAGRHADGGDVEDLLRWVAGRREASAPFLPSNVVPVEPPSGLDGERRRPPDVVRQRRQTIQVRRPLAAFGRGRLRPEAACRGPRRRA